MYISLNYFGVILTKNNCSVSFVIYFDIVDSSYSFVKLNKF